MFIHEAWKLYHSFATGEASLKQGSTRRTVKPRDVQRHGAEANILLGIFKTKPMNCLDCFSHLELGFLLFVTQRISADPKVIFLFFS